MLEIQRPMSHHTLLTHQPFLPRLIAHVLDTPFKKKSSGAFCLFILTLLPVAYYWKVQRRKFSIQMRKCGLMLQFCVLRAHEEKMQHFDRWDTCISECITEKECTQILRVLASHSPCKIKLVGQIFSSISIHSLPNTSEFTLQEDVCQMCKLYSQLLWDKSLIKVFLAFLVTRLGWGARGSLTALYKDLNLFLKYRSSGTNIIIPMTFLFWK